MKHPFLEANHEKVFTTVWHTSYSFASHFHSHIEITYCFSGTQKVKADNVTYTLTNGDAIIIFPNVVHEYIEVKNADAESISIICSLDALSDCFPQILSAYAKCPFVSSCNISNSAKLGFKKIEHSTDITEKIGWTYIILSNLLPHIEFMKKSGPTHTDLPSIIVSYINDNFSEPLTIASIAKKFGYSQSYIAHIFSDQLKIPFKTYINSIRCEQSAILLKKSQKSITEISYECGFNTLNTFCRNFKKFFNKTPSQYKAQD